MYTSLSSVVVVGTSCVHQSVICCGCRYIMEKVDFVLVGAEGVVESGGIINKVTL